MADPVVSNIDRLRIRVGSDWPALRKAREDTFVRLNELKQLFLNRHVPDTGLVVFGSVARFEVTSSSDLDWILLLDGSALPEHKEQEREIELELAEMAKKWYIKPGKSGVFGRMVASHDLVHNIGGEGDSNSNTTRRILLLLESTPIGNAEAYGRVRRQILRRYLEDDRGLLHASGPVRIPRFLLNDLTRYWHTITVDFVYKQRADNDNKWALRNAKLRMSRKLIFAAGLLNCFFCHLDSDAGSARDALKSGAGDISLLTAYLDRQLAQPPLEVIAKACVELEIAEETIRNIFDSYDGFLALLDDPEKRDALELVRTHEDLRTSSAWEEVRKVSRPFHEGLISLFLKDDKHLSELTMEYGIF